MTVYGLTSQIAPDRAQEWTAGRLAAPMPTLPVSATCGEACDWFADRSDQPAAAILNRDGSIAGLVNWLQFLALYARRSILNLASVDPVIVDEDTSIADLGASVALEHPEALSECFIVTAGGLYLGVGTGAALTRSKVMLLQLRDSELRSALEASREAVRAKTSVLALMSHDLRTPLNAIIGFSEVIHGEAFGALDQSPDVECRQVHAARWAGDRVGRSRCGLRDAQMAIDGTPGRGTMVRLQLPAARTVTPYVSSACAGLSRGSVLPATWRHRWPRACCPCGPPDSWRAASS